MSSSASGSEVAAIAAGTMAVFVAFGYALFRHLSGSFGQFIELMAPLVESEVKGVSLRLDAALRDADDGFNVCAACQFENLKRQIFCAICGSPVDATKPSEAKDKLHEQRQLASAHSNHWRQARALRRKEWVRKQDVEGKLYWFRETSTAAHGILLSRGYVLQFQGEPLASSSGNVGREEEAVEVTQPETELRETSARSEVIAMINASEQPSRELTAATENDVGRSSILEVGVVDSGEEDDVTPEERKPKRKVDLLAYAEVTSQLEDDMATRPLKLVNSDQADAGRSAVLVGTKSLYDGPKALLDHSHLDFPSKIAEFILQTSRLLLHQENAFLRMKMRRDALLADSLELLAAMPLRYARCSLRMAFVGEQGIDAGGVYREWLVLIHEQIISPEVGIFRCVDNEARSFYLNPTSKHDIGEHHLAHFFATGRLLGRVLLEGNVTGFHLALPLLKIIVGQPVTFSDLEYFDPEAYKSMLWLLDNDGVDTLGLDFTVTEVTAKGEAVTVELIPGGRNIDVDDNNKFEYVDCKLKYLLFGSVSTQLFAFLKGFYEVMPPEMLMLFDAEELDYVLSGSDEIDVDDWERTARYSADLVDHPVRKWFWDEVREMPNEYRRRLLLFATGSSRVPLAGFAALTSYDGRLCPFTLNGISMKDDGHYIRSHACFNQLDLPRYFKKHDLHAVLYGVLDTEMYGFTTA